MMWEGSSLNKQTIAALQYIGRFLALLVQPFRSFFVNFVPFLRFIYFHLLICSRDLFHLLADDGLSMNRKHVLEN